MTSRIAVVVAIVFALPAWSQITPGIIFEGPDQNVIPMNNPADNSLSVNGDWIASVVNKQIVLYDRNAGNVLGDSADLWSFLGIQAQLGYDVVVSYDPLVARHVITALGAFELHVAYSEVNIPIPLGVANDPGSAWDSVTTGMPVVDLECDFTNPEALLLDQPTLAIDGSAWYVSSANDQYAIGGGADRQVQVFHIFEKPTEVPPTPATEIDEVYSRDFIGPDLLPLGCSQYIGIQGGKGREKAVAARWNVHPPPAPYFVGIGWRKPGPGIAACHNRNFNRLRLFSMADPLDQSPMDGDRLLKYFDIQVPCFDANAIDVPTPDGDAFEGLDGRVASVYWRESLGDERLYVAHSVVDSISIMGDNVDQKVIRWYVINTNGWPHGAGIPVLEDSGQVDAGTIFDDEDMEHPVHLVYPAIAANDAGAVALMAAQSSVAHPISIQVTGRRVIDPPMTMLPLDEVHVSTTNAAPKNNRWGDYFGIEVDDDGLTFWGFGSYIEADQYFNTKIFEFNIF